MEHDFSGWATRNDILCSDGKIISKDAFLQNDGEKVPLVWNHQHNDPSEVLGHALLENRDNGVYAYCKFNDTESGQIAKKLVVNGDVDKLSIYANKLKTELNRVIHGSIREVSLVLSGANPGAYIESVMVHSEDGGLEEEATIYTDEYIELPDDEDNLPIVEVLPESDVVKHADKEEVNMKEEKSIADIFDTLDEEQKEAVYAIIGQVMEENGLVDKNGEEIKQSDMLEESEETGDEPTLEDIVEVSKESEEEHDEESEEEEGEDEHMKHNVFDNEMEDTLMHSGIVNSAITEANRFGSLKESFLAHAAANNIQNIGDLFPESKELNVPPALIRKDDSFVGVIMNEVNHVPFSRVRTTFGNVTADDARAKGYIKGGLKADHVITLLKRSTTPTTVYIKGKMDRDDAVDITGFDVVLWIKAMMRKQLDRELAVAMLLGDGRDASSDDKINELNIRPIYKDDALYAIKYEVKDGVDYDSSKANDSKTKGIIRAAIKARKNYKGSGNPTFFTTEATLTDMLLLEDTNGRIIYDNIDKLATTLRVKKIVTVPEMEKYTKLFGIIVNFNDYTAGADRGGQVNTFDDFDIDYNQQKYLIETRMSGALTVPYSAIVLKEETTSTPTPPPTPTPTPTPEPGDGDGGEGGDGGDGGDGGEEEIGG